MLIALLLFWIMLSGNFSPFFISASLFSSVLGVAIIQQLFKKETFILEVLKNWIYFVLAVLKEIFISSWNVTKLVWFNSDEINQCYGWVNVNSSNQDTQMIFANSITLTPGTMSLEVKDNMIRVHSLSLRYLEDLHNGNLNQSILKLERNS